MIPRDATSLERVAGGALFVGIDGEEPTPELERFLDDLRPGGVILFSRNVRDGPQTCALARWLQDPGDGPARLVGVDQEGGRVNRLRPVLGPLPAAADIAREGPSGARAFGHRVGGALRALGFNLNFAPVLDLSVPGAANGIGDRAFGDDPPTVARLGRAYLEGLAAAGIFGVAKHFPGLGPTSVDSHVSLPTAAKDGDAFRREDLSPFRAVLSLAPLVMIGHAHYPFLDDHPIPASCSRNAVDGLLRGELGYEGVTVADDLEMGAVSRDGKAWFDSAEAALSAGCDMLLVCHSRDRMLRLRDELARRARPGTPLAERLIEAGRRVEDLRRRAAAPAPADDLALYRDELIRRRDRA